jgi:hypothetical protein
MNKSRKVLTTLARDDKYKEGIGSLTIGDYAAKAFGGDNYTGRRRARMYLTLEYAAAEVINFMRKITYPNSSSHKRISDLHMKMSGRDLVRNEMRLQSPFNAVKLSHPSEELDIEALKERAMTGLAPTEVHTEGTIPLHRTLKPWAWKVYSTFFRNINVFPSANTSVRSMVISSVLSNLMKETYSGNIVLLGDPTIRENDRILLWDENRDFYGIIGVRSHTFIMSQDEGCLSIIEPDMVTKTMYNIYDSTADVLLWAFGTVLTLGMYALTLGAFIKFGRSVVKGFRYKSLANRLKSGESSTRKVRNSGLLASISTRVNQSGRSFINRRVVPALDKIKNRTGLFSGKNLHFSTNEKIIVARDKITTVCANMMRRIEDTFIKNKKLTEGGQVIVDQLAANPEGLKMSVEGMEALEISAWKSVITRISKTGVFSKNTAKGISKRPDPTKSISDQGVIDIRKMYAEELAFRMIDVANKRRAKGAKALDIKDHEQLVSKLLESRPGKDPLIATTTTEGNVTVNLAYVKMEDEMLAIVRGLKEDKALSLANKHVSQMVRDSYEIARYVSFNYWGISDLIKWYGNLLAGYSIAKWGLQNTKDLVEMWCVTTETQDNVVLSPIYFRGEPFLAGVDSMNKEDGRRMGMVDIMTARFSDILTAGIDSLTSPMADSLNKYLQQEYALKSRIGMNNPLTVVRRTTPFADAESKAIIEER